MVHDVGFEPTLTILEIASFTEMENRAMCIFYYARMSKSTGVTI